jgi:hypothetical protein
MAEEDVHHLSESTWMGIVENCLRPLTPTQVHQGLQLLRIAPLNSTTTFQQRFRCAVYERFHQYATGRERIVNVTGDQLSLQLTYDVDLNTIVSAASRMNFRELFSMYLTRASYVYRDNGDAQKQAEAEALVIAIMNL